MDLAESDQIKEEEQFRKEDEEFYENIEAPKFVDFTKPYTFRTDDRYWFCSRLGCDQKHEEEINPEEISKNFILRVMAARSPNIKLRKALNREHISKKCPLSAPAKPSKPRIPKLPMVKTGPCSKDGSTPVAKSRQVAAKYMTTPRNKMCRPNPNSFRSVQNPKTTTVDVIKNRPVAKALVFHSPKRAICIKKSFELKTSLTKICQKKTLNTSPKSKLKKPETEDLSKKLKICKSDKTSEDLAFSKSTKTPKKKIPSKKCDFLCEKDVENGSGDMDIDMKPKVSNANGINRLSNLEDKENFASGEDCLNEAVEGDTSRKMDDNDDSKENALNHQDNNRSNNQTLGDKILSKATQNKNKVVQTVAKCKKPKPTCIKPFRLRTDERGILREAILEKKLNITASEKEAAKDTSMIKKTFCVAKNDKFPTGNICGKESSTAESKPANNATRKRPESTQQRFVTSFKTRSQGVVSPRKARIPSQQLCTIKEKSRKLATDVMVTENKSRVVSGARSALWGNRHVPKTCSKKIA